MRVVTRIYFIRIKFAFYKFYLKNIPEFVNKPRKMVIPCVAEKYSAYLALPKLTGGESLQG